MNFVKGFGFGFGFGIAVGGIGSYWLLSRSRKVGGQHSDASAVIGCWAPSLTSPSFLSRRKPKPLLVSQLPRPAPRAAMRQVTNKSAWGRRDEIASHFLEKLARKSPYLFPFRSALIMIYIYIYFVSAGRNRNATSRQCNGNSRNWERGQEVWVTTIKIALRRTART